MYLISALVLTVMRPNRYLILVFALSLITLLFAGGYWFGTPWIGVWDYASITYKTLWDWTELLVAPIAIAVAAIALDSFAKRRADELEGQRRMQSLYSDFVGETTERLLASEPSDPSNSVLLFAVKLQFESLVPQFDSKWNARLFRYLGGLAQRFPVGHDTNIDGMHHFELLTFNHSRFMNCQFEDVNFAGYRLFQCDFSGSKFDRARFDAVEVNYCYFRGASLRRAILYTIRGIQCDFGNCDFRDSVIDGLYSPRSNFTGADFTGSKVEVMYVKESDFTGAKAPNGASAVAWLSKKPEWTESVPEQLKHIENLSHADK